MCVCVYVCVRVCADISFSVSMTHLECGEVGMAIHHPVGGYVVSMILCGI